MRHAFLPMYVVKMSGRKLQYSFVLQVFPQYVSWKNVESKKAQCSFAPRPGLSPYFNLMKMSKEGVNAIFHLRSLSSLALTVQRCGGLARSDRTKISTLKPGIFLRKPKVFWPNMLNSNILCVHFKTHQGGVGTKKMRRSFAPHGFPYIISWKVSNQVVNVLPLFSFRSAAVLFHWRYKSAEGCSTCKGQKKVFVEWFFSWWKVTDSHFLKRKSKNLTI